MKAPKEENLQKLNMRRREASMMEYHIKSISNNTNTKEYSWEKENEMFSKNVVRKRENDCEK